MDRERKRNQMIQKEKELRREIDREIHEQIDRQRNESSIQNNVFAVFRYTNR